MTDGWSHDDAVAALEGNLWSMWSVFGRGPRSRLIDTPEVLAYETPMTRAPYNAVFRFRVDDDPDRAIDELLIPYRERGVPVMWTIHPTARPADLRDRLRARGLRLAEVIPGMVADLTHLLPIPEAPDGIEIVEGSADAVDDWIHLVSWRYELQSDGDGYLQGLYREAIGDPDSDWVTRWWMARRDGEPLSKTVLHLGAGVAGIYGVATRMEGRGMGLGSALTLTALHAARTGGMQRAVLHSTPMAVSLYDRIGFRRVADFEVWAEEGSLHL